MSACATVPPVRGRRPSRLPLFLTLAIVGALTAPGAAHDPPRTTVTWNGDIARLVHSRCTRCHSPEGKGPMSLVTYEDARPWARAMREEVLARRMPKWHAARGYGEFANDPTLSPFDISLIVSWVDGGAARGDASKASEAAPAGAGPTVRPRTRNVTMACGERTLPAGRLLALEPALAEGASAGFSIVFPDGRQEILAWIREYEAEFADIYWRETPLILPRGSRLRVDGDPGCRVTLMFARGGA